MIRLLTLRNIKVHNASELSPVQTADLRSVSIAS